MVPNIGKYEVPIQTNISLKTSLKTMATIGPASANDMPTNWTYPWTDFWNANSIEGLTIIKMFRGEDLLGLVQYGLFPTARNPSFLAIDRIEANPDTRHGKPSRLVEPIGKWLIWYCIETSLKYCSGDEKLLFLFSTNESFDYYNKIIGMEYKDAVNFHPGEVHAFSLSKIHALQYKQKQEECWGIPIYTCDSKPQN